MPRQPMQSPQRFVGATRRGVLVAGMAVAAGLVSACTSSLAPAAPTAPVAAPPRPSVATSAATPPSAAATAGATPTPSVSQPLTAQRLIDKPLPTNYFIPMGSVAEMRFEDLHGKPYGVPPSLFFVRDHVASVVVDAKQWRLNVEGDGIDRPFSLTYEDLLNLPSTTVTRYVECAGNGRSFFQTFLNKPAQGGQWHLGGWGVTNWTGVRLSEILDRAGLKKSAVEVLATGLDQPRIRRPIPVAKALEDDTLVVYGMNGDLLPIDHGYPARLLVPGWVGVANIKWLGSLAVTTTPNWTDWNTNLYILIGPDYQPQGPAKGPPISEQVMKSAVALPWPAKLAAGPQTLTGYAWSPKGKITKVDVSVDGGKTWTSARLVEPNVEKAGVRWELDYVAKRGDSSILPRATDETGATQPSIAEQKWNQQGYLFAAAVPHPIEVS